MSDNFASTPNKYVMAPMLGITDVAFRSAFAKHYAGFSGSIAPFVRIKFDGTFKESKMRELLPERNADLRVLPQFMSNRAEAFVAAQSAVADMGYKEINWNLGCPSPTSAGRGMGSGLMPDVAAVEHILENHFSQSPLSLSIKTRVGYKSSGDLETLMQVFNKFPLTAIYIHPRTGVQKYSGSPDLDAFCQAEKLSQNPVVYSGDITTSEDVTRVQQRIEHARTFLVGRGILKDPHLIERLTGKLDTEFSIKRYLNFVEDLASRYLEADLGVAQTLLRLRNNWYYLADHQNLCLKTKKNIKKAKSLEHFFERIQEPYC